MSLPELRTIDEIRAYKEWIGSGQRQHVYGRVAGTDEVVRVPREDNGKPAGEQIKHWDGRVSAKIFAPTAVHRLGASGAEGSAQ